MPAHSYDSLHSEEVRLYGDAIAAQEEYRLVRSQKNANIVRRTWRAWCKFSDNEYAEPVILDHANPTR